MAKKILDAKAFTKNLNAMVDTLSERAEAFQRYVVSELATEAEAEIRSRAPSDQDLPHNYKDQLEVVKVDGRGASYAVVYRGKPAIVSKLDPEQTVLYINVNDSQMASKEARLFAALSKFQPFTMDTMPLDIPRDTGFIMSRSVTKAEVELVRKRVTQKKEAIDAIIRTKGKGLTSIVAFNHNSALLFSDLAFQVLRKELGIGLSKKPHWRPAIRFVQSDPSFLKNLMMSTESLRLWNDPNYHGFTKLGTMVTNVSESSVEDVEYFQKKIIDKG